MSHGKQFTLFTHINSPSGWRVTFVLGLLGLTFQPRYLGFSDVKGPEHTKYNPNGRIPTLIDHHNNDFVLWESGAIILYLTEKYDLDRTISVSSFEEKAILTQWLFYMASGQGPYYGQVIWFTRSHPEKVPSVIQRYQNETRRVLGVLESVLSKQEWLVGGKFTVADLAFVTWNHFLSSILGEDFDFDKEFPSTSAWNSKMLSIKAVKDGYAESQRLIEEDQRKKTAELN